ncbi:MAG TPA: hypothetical protein VJ935_08810 [Acidimicrobiia bacterium]|nr:hypothetical protein [Acidimicrobiia bacterium]
MRLSDPKQIVPYVRKLEQALIETLSDFGVAGWREEGMTGVWTEEGKVAAIRGPSLPPGDDAWLRPQPPDMSYFAKMNPCGITDRPVATLSSLAGPRVSLEEAVAAFIPHFLSVFEVEEAETQLGAFTRGQGADPRFEVDRLLEAGTFSAERRQAEPILVNGRLPGEPPRPEWMKLPAPSRPAYRSSQA